MTNKELLLDALMKEYSRALHLSAELSDTDEDYNYLDGVLDGRMRSLRNIIDLIRKMTDTTTNTTTTTTNNTTINNTEDYLETVKGKQGTQSYAGLLLEFRETFLNIDMMVIEDLSELFMNIWTGGYPF